VFDYHNKISLFEFHRTLVLEVVVWSTPTHTWLRP